MNRPLFGRAHCVNKNGVKIASMHHPIGRPVTCNGRFAKIKKLPRLTGVEQPNLLTFGNAGDRLDRVTQPQRDQNTRAIGADLQTGTQFAQFRRLLVDVDVESLPQQSERGNETANSGSGKCDYGRLQHILAILRSGGRRVVLEVAPELPCAGSNRRLC